MMMDQASAIVSGTISLAQAPRDVGSLTCEAGEGGRMSKEGDQGVIPREGGVLGERHLRTPPPLSWLSPTPCETDSPPVMALTNAMMRPCNPPQRVTGLRTAALAATLS